MAKRGNGEGSIFKDSNGRWRVSLSAGEVDGKRKRLTRIAKTRADAVVLRDQMRAELARPKQTEDPTTVSEWLHTWLENGRTHWAEATHIQYRYAVNWIKDEIGYVRLSALSPQQVRSLLTKLKDEKGASGRVLQLVRSTLMAAYNAAIHDDRLAVNPIVKVKTPAAEREEINPFTEDEVRLILGKTAGERYHAMYALAFYAGLRIGECLGLRWSRVDLDSGTIRVEEQLIDIGGQLKRTKPKTVTSCRTVELPKAVITALQTHRAILMREGNAGSELVFPSPQGKPTRRTNFVRRYWGAMLTRLGLEHRGFHHTRHTFATLALRRGVPLSVVSSVLGHASPEITLRVYSHFLRGDQRMAVAAMDSIATGGSSVATTEIRKSS